jgi:methylisocitrate lyase
LSGKRLIPAEEMSAKIKSAVKARTNKGFLIIARTDARGVKGMKEAIKRADAYLDAGADAVFPEGLETREEFKRFAKEIHAPLLANMTEFGKTPYITADEFEDMGYKMVIFPMTGFRVMLKSVRDAMTELRTSGTQVNLLDKMLTRKELYKILKYENFIA